MRLFDNNPPWKVTLRIRTFNGPLELGTTRNQSNDDEKQLCVAFAKLL
jgi:hypothetical protein